MWHSPLIILSMLTLIRDFFKRNNCIYVELAERNSTKRVTWATLKECAKRGINLEARYPTCRYLFGIVLGPEKIKISSLLANAESINLSTGLVDILRIFTIISRAIGTMNPLEAIRVVKPLMKKSIMPVRKPESTLPYDLVAPQDAEWFITDRMDLQVIFRDKVPLLAFSVDEMREIKKLLDSLDLSPRNLSQCVQERQTPKPPFDQCNSLEASLRGRVTFIAE